MIKIIKEKDLQPYALHNWFNEVINHKNFKEHIGKTIRYNISCKKELLEFVNKMMNVKVVTEKENHAEFNFFTKTRFKGRHYNTSKDEIKFKLITKL
jgi:hypothetical protein